MWVYLQRREGSSTSAVPPRHRQHRGCSGGAGAAAVVDPGLESIVPLPPTSAGGCGSTTRGQQRTKNEGFVLVNNG